MSLVLDFFLLYLAPPFLLVILKVYIRERIFLKSGRVTLIGCLEREWDGDKVNTEGRIQVELRRKTCHAMSWWTFDNLNSSTWQNVVHKIWRTSWHFYIGIMCLKQSSFSHQKVAPNSMFLDFIQVWAPFGKWHVIGVIAVQITWFKVLWKAKRGFLNFVKDTNPIQNV